MASPHSDRKQGEHIMDNLFTDKQQISADVQSDGIKTHAQEAIEEFCRADYNLGRNRMRDVVRFNDDPDAWGGVTEESEDYDSRKRQYFTCRYARLYLPADWRIRVLKRGISVIDGLFTVDAVPLDSGVDGVEVYAAKWLKQAQGTSLRTAEGFIAMFTGEDGKRYSYHSEVSAQKAIAGVIKKSNVKAKLALPIGKKFSEFMQELIEKYGDFDMRAEDARVAMICAARMYRSRTTSPKAS